MKQSRHCLLCVAKNCDWLWIITPLSHLTRASLLMDENLQRKQNWTAKSTNLKENTGKVKSIWSSEQPCERKSLDVALNMQEMKKCLRKTCGCGQPLAFGLNERSVSDGGNVCLLWLTILKSVGCELWLAILCSLLCPETDWNIRIGKQDCVFILTDFNKWSMFWRFIPDVNQCVNGYFETGKRWIFLIN